MASKRRIRRNACGSKVKYPSYKQALSVAMIVKKKTGTAAYVDAYKCKFCNQWHWGNK